MTPRKPALDALAVACLVGCCFLWGLNQVVAKTAMGEVPPLVQAAVRSLVSAALVWGWAAWRGVALFGRDGSLRGGLAVGALFGLEFGCIFAGLALTAASRIVVFIYLAPFVVALGMPFIDRAEQLSKAQWAGLVIAFAGVATAFSEGFTHAAVGPRAWQGDALGIAGGVLWGITTLLVRATPLAAAPAEKTLFYQLGVSGVLLAAAAAAVAPGGIDAAGWAAAAARLSALALASLAFQSVVIAFASYLVWFWLMRRYPASRLSAFTLLTPLFGLALGALLLGEPVTPRLAFGVVAVSAGIALVNLRRG